MSLRDKFLLSVIDHLCTLTPWLPSLTFDIYLPVLVKTQTYCSEYGNDS